MRGLKGGTANRGACLMSAQQPSGEAPEEITPIPLRYEESPPQDEYGQVMIAHGRGEIVVNIGRPN